MVREHSQFLLHQRNYISVNSKGKVTLKKGAKKGTYKVTVKYYGNRNYKAGTKTISIKVK